MRRRDVLRNTSAGALFAFSCNFTLSGCAQTKFSKEETESLEDIADAIIPETDTPGARAAGVHFFIAQIVFEWMDGPECDGFLAGFRSFLPLVRRITGKNFADLSQDEKVVLLEEVSSSSGSKWSYDVAEFVKKMKSLTLYGYYTSEIGASQELNFNLVTEHYSACTHIGATERAPALAVRSPALP